LEVGVKGNRVSNRPEWQQALLAPPAERSGIMRTMAPTLSADELVDLVELVRAGSADEQDTALRLLGPLVRSRDAEIQSRLPRDWQTAAWTVLREQTFTPAGMLAWHLLSYVDREKVNDFLSKIPLADLSEADRVLLIGRLSLMKTPQST
jgi:hypothetical protein